MTSYTCSMVVNPGLKILQAIVPSVASHLCGCTDLKDIWLPLRALIIGTDRSHMTPL